MCVYNLYNVPYDVATHSFLLHTCSEGSYTCVIHIIYTLYMRMLFVCVGIRSLFCWIKQNRRACVHSRDTRHLVLSKTSCVSCCVASGLAWGHRDADSHCWFQDDEILLPFTKWLDLAQTECCVPSTHWSSSCQQRYVHAHILCSFVRKRRFLEGWQRISNSRWKLWAKKEIYLKMPASVLITQNLDGCLIQNKSETFKV